MFLSISKWNEGELNSKLRGASAVGNRVMTRSPAAKITVSLSLRRYIPVRSRTYFVSIGALPISARIVLAMNLRACRYSELRMQRWSSVNQSTWSRSDNGTVTSVLLPFLNRSLTLTASLSPAVLFFDQANHRGNEGRDWFSSFIVKKPIGEARSCW